jgi:hypothetical protein
MEQNVIEVTVCSAYFQVHENPANYQKLNTQFSATIPLSDNFSINKELIKCIILWTGLIAVIRLHIGQEMVGWGPGWRCRYSALLQAGRSAD